MDDPCDYSDDAIQMVVKWAEQQKLLGSFADEILKEGPFPNFTEEMFLKEIQANNSQDTIPSSSAQIQAISQIQTISEVQAESQIQTISEVQRNSQIQTISEVQVDSQIQTSSEVQADSQVETSSEVQVNSQIQTSSEVQSDSQIQTSSEVQADSQGETSSEVQADSQPQTSFQAESNFQVQTSSQVQSDSKCYSCLETRNNQRIRSRDSMNGMVRKYNSANHFCTEDFFHHEIRVYESMTQFMNFQEIRSISPSFFSDSTDGGDPDNVSKNSENSVRTRRKKQKKNDEQDVNIDPTYSLEKEKPGPSSIKEKVKPSIIKKSGPSSLKKKAGPSSSKKRSRVFLESEVGSNECPSSSSLVGKAALSSAEGRSKPSLESVDGKNESHPNPSTVEQSSEENRSTLTLEYDYEKNKSPLKSSLEEMADISSTEIKSKTSLESTMEKNESPSNPFRVEEQSAENKATVSIESAANIKSPSNLLQLEKPESSSAENRKRPNIEPVKDNVHQFKTLEIKKDKGSNIGFVNGQPFEFKSKYSISNGILYHVMVGKCLNKQFNATSSEAPNEVQGQPLPKETQENLVPANKRKNMDETRWTEHKRQARTHNEIGNQEDTEMIGTVIKPEVLRGNVRNEGKDDIERGRNVIKTSEVSIGNGRNEGNDDIERGGNVIKTSEVIIGNGRNEGNNGDTERGGQPSFQIQNPNDAIAINNSNVGDSNTSNIDIEDKILQKAAPPSKVTEPRRAVQSHASTSSMCFFCYDYLATQGLYSLKRIYNILRGQDEEFGPHPSHFCPESFSLYNMRF